MLQDELDAVPGLDPETAETAVLLASELAENAVLHAGTEFEVGLEIDGESLTVSVTDRGSGPLEAHLAEPRRRYGRAASHGRGLGLVARMATAWGTRHDADGRHTIWFTLAAGPPAQARAAAAPPTTRRGGSAPSRPDGCCTSRRDSATGCSPSSWSRSSAGGWATCSTSTRWPSSSTRATGRASSRSPAPGRRAGRSSSTSRCR